MTQIILREKFYAASNCIFSYTSGLAELLQLRLQQSCCLPILQYATCAIWFNQSQLRSLNVCWNDVFRKIYKFNRPESVTEFIGGLGYLNFINSWYLSVIKFIKSSMVSPSCVLRDVGMVFIHGKEYGDLSQKLNITYSMPVYVMRQTIYAQFNSISLTLPIVDVYRCSVCVSVCF